MAAKTAENSAKNEARGLYQTWMLEITQALTREKQYRVKAKKVVELYEARNAEVTPFAILYSNTETLAPAVYNQRPIPFVDRRFKDTDPLGKSAAETGTRLLKYLIEAESASYENFDELVNVAVLNTLITNRGITRAKYDADTSGETVKNECVYCEDVRWDKFFHGYARTWKKVPWIGFEWDMTPEEVKENFPEQAHQFNYAPPEEDGDSSSRTTSGETREETTGAKLAKVYEIWDKDTRKVYFFSPSWKEGALKTVDDPLQLANFFPVPKPLNFTRKLSTLIPTPLYTQYEQQAKELNELTIRLKNIIKACKIRGMYNSTVTGIEKLLEADDNTLVAAENMQSMPENTTMDKLIWLMPIDELVQAAQSLYEQREKVKNVIYEITGISDILRGASMASETATAQNIKNQWGTLRLKRMQKEVQRYCRDLLRLMLEIAATKFGVQTVAQMTDLQYPTKQQQEKAQQLVQQTQQVLQQWQASQPPPQPPQPGQPPQPPQQPQMPPQLQQMEQAAQQAQQILQQPSWEDILGLLKNDILRSYRVDIETNSTIDAEASQDKQDIAELLNALSQFLNGIAPLIENGSMPFDVAKGILLAICRRYTFGPQVEDALQAMKAPEPQNGPDAGDQAKMQTIQLQAQADQAAAQAQQQMIQLKAQAEAQKMDHATQQSMVEHQIKMTELAASLEQSKRQAQFDVMRHNLAVAQLEHKTRLTIQATEAAAKAKATAPEPKKK